MSEQQPPFRSERVRDLAALEDGWDSYGAHAPTDAALRVADALAVVPTPDGGVQVELHGGGWDVEIVVAPTGQIIDISASVAQPHPSLSAPTAQSAAADAGRAADAPGPSSPTTYPTSSDRRCDDAQGDHRG